MDIKVAVFLLALLSSSLASSITERLNRRREEIPCNKQFVEALKRMGLYVDHARCYSRNLARSTNILRDDSERLTSKRSSCCGPECVWMMKTAGIDPATVSCPSKD